MAKDLHLANMLTNSLNFLMWLLKLFFNLSLKACLNVFKESAKSEQLYHFTHLAFIAGTANLWHMTEYFSYVID